MNIGDRIRILRDTLGLTQGQFAERLNLKQNTIANYEIGRREPQGSTTALICNEFNVNEKWLTSGEGVMFKQALSFSLDEFARQHQMTELEKDVIKAYLMIDPAIRGHVLDAAKGIFLKDRDREQKDAEAEKDIESKVEAYRQELLAEKKKKEESSLSQTTKEA